MITRIIDLIKYSLKNLHNWLILFLNSAEDYGYDYDYDYEYGYENDGKFK